MNKLVNTYSFKSALSQNKMNKLHTHFKIFLVDSDNLKH